MKRVYFLTLLLLLIVLSFPANGVDAPLPAGNRYTLSDEELHVTEKTDGIFLFPGDGMTEVRIDGVPLPAGEARMLRGNEEITLIPLADGEFETTVHFWLSEEDGGGEEVKVELRYESAVGNLPEVRPVKAFVYGGEIASGSFEGHSPYGETAYILLSTPQKGRVEAEGGGWRYYPYDGETGKDVFRYAAVDKLGRVSSPARVTVEFREAVPSIKASSKEHFPKKRAFLFGLYS